MTIEPRAPEPPSNPSFPLNVQEGSPQYTLTSQITPSPRTTFITVTNTDSIVPISNAYYTIQNEDGSKWCTFYIGQWTKESTTNYYTGACTYSSSNTSDVFPEGSLCWCIWCKEYYDSLVTQITDSPSGVNVSDLIWDSNLTVPSGKSITTPTIYINGVNLHANYVPVTNRTVSSGGNTFPITSTPTTFSGNINFDNTSYHFTVTYYMNVYDPAGRRIQQTTLSEYLDDSYWRTSVSDLSIPIGATSIEFRSSNKVYSFSGTLSNYNTTYIY